MHEQQRTGGFKPFMLFSIGEDAQTVPQAPQALHKDEVTFPLERHEDFALVPPHVQQTGLR